MMLNLILGIEMASMMLGFSVRAEHLVSMLWEEMFLVFLINSVFVFNSCVVLWLSDFSSFIEAHIKSLSLIYSDKWLTSYKFFESVIEIRLQLV